MKRAAAGFLCVLCAACVSTPERPRQLLAMPVALPACLLLCSVHVTVTEQGATLPPPAPKPKEQ